MKICENRLKPPDMPPPYVSVPQPMGHRAVFELVIELGVKYVNFHSGLLNFAFSVFRETIPFSRQRSRATWQQKQCAAHLKFSSGMSRVTND